MAHRADKSEIESAFREQYRALDDDTLREIASGKVPWTREGRYLHPARRAARALLLERGASDVPHVSSWDPKGPLPLGVRALVAVTALAIAAGAIGIAAATNDGVPDADEACAVAHDLLATTPFAQRYQLELVSCDVDDGARAGDTTVVPIRFTACVTLDDRALGRLHESSHAGEAAAVRRLSDRPARGRHCRAGGVVLAELVERDGRPWFVRLTAPLP